jgi:hypothetical protein
VVPLKIMTTADQHIVASLAGDDEIIRHQPVASLNEIEHAL